MEKYLSDLLLFLVVVISGLFILANYAGKIVQNKAIKTSNNYYVRVFQQTWNFKTRARRKEFWMFTLFNAIICLVLSIIDSIFIIFVGTHLPVFCIIYLMIASIPSLSVSIRRLHDIGRSGLWLLIGFIPLIGGILCILLLVWFCTDSQIGENKYGANPKGIN